jgi:hypothetical protein
VLLLPGAIEHDRFDESFLQSQDPSEAHLQLGGAWVVWGDNSNPVRCDIISPGREIPHQRLLMKPGGLA